MNNLLSNKNNTQLETFDIYTQANQQLEHDTIRHINTIANKLGLSPIISKINNTGLYHHWIITVDGTDTAIQELARHLKIIKGRM